MSSMCQTCGLPKEVCVCEEIAREQQEIVVSTEARRYGKMVTIVSGMDAGDIDVKALAADLKSACACGGTQKDGKIELQGDHKRQVLDVLAKMGFKASPK